MKKDPWFNKKKGKKMNKNIVFANENNKKGNIRYFINKNIWNLFLVLLLSVIVLIVTTKIIFPTLLNVFFSPFEFDPASMKVKIHIMNIDDIHIDENNIGRHYNYERQKILELSNMFKENNKYVFKVRPSMIIAPGLEYSTYASSIFYEKEKLDDSYSIKYIILDMGEYL